LQIKVLSLNEGLGLLRRYKRNGGVGKEFNAYCKEARVWKYGGKLVVLIADTLLANAVLHDELIESDYILPDLIAEWAAIHRPEEDEIVLLKKVEKLTIASSSRCIYTFCAFLIERVSTLA
jgi:hypothetical protein